MYKFILIDDAHSIELMIHRELDDGFTTHSDPFLSDVYSYHLWTKTKAASKKRVTHKSANKPDDLRCESKQPTKCE
uniref:Uncharacterized protein n=1 Tax=Tetranychus urticae TaxID=32264 RepID=T1JZT2_TETUR